MLRYRVTDRRGMVTGLLLCAQNSNNMARKSHLRGSAHTRTHNLRPSGNKPAAALVKRQPEVTRSTTHLCTYCIPGQTKALPPGTSRGLRWQHPAGHNRVLNLIQCLDSVITDPSISIKVCAVVAEVAKLPFLALPKGCPRINYY